MKTVLCYGDSNTYGYVPSTGLRYPKSVRWTGILQEMLGREYQVIEEGCNGRTTVFVDPEDPWRTGIDYIKSCVYSHQPVDLVVVMLGTNDLKFRFGNVPAQEIADGAGQIIDAIRELVRQKKMEDPKILLIAPPVIGKDMPNSRFADQFDETSITRSMQFEACYRKVAEEKDCFFLNAADVVESSPVDNLHLEPECHKALAEAVCEKVKEILE